MIYDALIAPHERPVTLREIKRALLTYDKVVLIDPDDRDILPSNTFMAAVMGMPLFGLDTGPVRPMYKVVGYDEDFSMTIEACRAAEEQSLLEVRSTYVKQDPGFMTIGSVQTGGYPLDLGFVFWLYRTMASDQAFLSSAVGTDAQLARDIPDEAVEALCCGDGRINDIPALPPLVGLEGDEESTAKLTQVARGRLGAFVKYAGYCEAKDLVPVLPSAAYGAIASRLLTNAQNVFASSEVEPFWGRRNRVLELCHEEFMVDGRLDEISISEVLKVAHEGVGEASGGS